MTHRLERTPSVLSSRFIPCYLAIVGGLSLFAAVAPTIAAPSVSGGGMTLVPLSIDYPTSDRAFPPGPGVDTMEGNCGACHSVGMILNQPSLSHATWEAEVRKMINIYKAPVSEEDAKTIVAYLDAIKGVTPAK